MFKKVDQKKMKLNHINLVVQDVAGASRFFETWFGFRCIEIKGENIVAILKGDNDFTLVLMKSKEPEVSYPGAFHIGFMQPGKEQVIELHKKLQSAGLIESQEPKKIRDSFGFYFAYENIMIEVGCYTE